VNDTIFAERMPAIVRAVGGVPAALWAPPRLDLCADAVSDTDGSSHQEELIANEAKRTQPKGAGAAILACYSYWDSFGITPRSTILYRFDGTYLLTSRACRKSGA
jgi:hypothetical protein